MSLDILKPEYSKGGYSFHYVIRTPDAAVYEQRDGKRIAGYEAFEVKVRQPTESNFVDIPTECYPGNEAFGSHAWSFNGSESKGRAIERMHEIQEGVDNR